MSLSFPLSFNDWLSIFLSRKDPRKLKNTLARVQKSKSVSEKDAWGAVAACAVAGWMNGCKPPGIPAELVNWASKKGPDRELLLLAIEVLERLPRKYAFEAEYAISLATVH